MTRTTIEICCGSAEDVFQSKLAGAHRVELNSALFLGGLTPSLGEMSLARQSDLPILCMVRPRMGGFCYSETEFETMLLDAQYLLEAGADGIVFGFLHPDGTVDKVRCARMMNVIGDKESVFHRAIDVTPNWRVALDILCDLGTSRILTSGQQPSVLSGAQTVYEMNHYANGRIEILPGAGVNLYNAKEILKITGCTQIHASMSKLQTDQSTEFNPVIHFSNTAPPPDDSFHVTDVEKVRTLVSQLS